MHLEYTHTHTCLFTCVNMQCFLVHMFKYNSTGVCVMPGCTSKKILGPFCSFCSTYKQFGLRISGSQWMKAVHLTSHSVFGYLRIGIREMQGRWEEQGCVDIYGGLAEVYYLLYTFSSQVLHI